MTPTNDDILDYNKEPFDSRATDDFTIPEEELDIATISSDDSLISGKASTSNWSYVTLSVMDTHLQMPVYQRSESLC